MTDVFNKISSLKEKLAHIEKEIDNHEKNAEIREENWLKLEQTAKYVINYQNDEIIKFNVGGKKFATRMETLMSNKDTLFYKLITSSKINLQKEIYFDRSNRMFPFIMDYFRNGSLNYTKLNQEELEELRIEADFYEIKEITIQLDIFLTKVDFISFNFNGNYSLNNEIAGTNKVEDLHDRSLKKGICTKYGGWIIIELNIMVDFEYIEIGGYNGNLRLWSPINGRESKIYTSKDKKIWTEVGKIPSDYADYIQDVKLKRTTAKYIKFEHHSYLGIGFLNIKKLS